MDTITEAELLTIEARCAAAADGPWSLVPPDRSEPADSAIIEWGPESLRRRMVVEDATTGDQQFIVAARSDVPRLVREVRSLLGGAKRTLDDNELATIEHRAAAATRGPWIAFVEGRDFPLGGSTFIKKGDEFGPQCELYVWRVAEETLDFIAAARQDIPHLVSVIRRLKASGT